MAKKVDRAESAAKSAAAKAAHTARANALRERARESRTGRYVGGFMDFVRRQGVVGLAVGLAIGTQASEFVRNIVSSVITPTVDLLVGEGGLKELTWTLEIGNRTGVYDFGLLIDSLMKFMAVAVVIYFVVQGLKLDRLDKKKE
jgi:large conductance mechanosensitive channel protein